MKFSFIFWPSKFKGSNSGDIITANKPVPTPTTFQEYIELSCLNPNCFFKLKNTANTFKKPKIVKARDLPKEYENFDTSVGEKSQTNITMVIKDASE